jgi:uncharacterized protein YecE (DUF72 family)
MIRTGTCSWAEKSLIASGDFYPRGVRTAEERLRHYSSRFDTVEVDSTYYAIPRAQTAALWAARTPGGFTFHIKVYGALTGHGIDPGTLPRELRGALTGRDREKPYIYVKEPSLISVMSDALIEALRPLREAGKLGVMVFQYPPWFQFSTKNLDYILTSKENMKGLPAAVEFRHGSWLTREKRDSVFRFMRENQLTYVTADEPQYGDLKTVPFLPEATTDTAYFRLHGRNRTNWLKKGIETSLRYDYLYSDSELRDFVPSMESVNRRAKETYVMFNNCHGGFAMRNAAGLREIISAEEES